MCKSVLTLQGIGVDLKNLSALYVIISAMIIIAFLIGKLNSLCPVLLRSTF